MDKPSAIFLGGERGAEELFARVYLVETRARIGTSYALQDKVMTLADLRDPEQQAVFASAEVVFSSWGMPALTEADLALMPRLRAVLYAAGTVQHFAWPLLTRGITVMSAWAANALPVAEFTVAQILLALKGAQRSMLALRERKEPAAWRAGHVVGTYRSTVALISLGMIGRRVAELLKPFDVKVIAYEPFADAAVSIELGIEPVSLQDCFHRGDVVSLHAPNLPSTREMISRDLLASMKPGATFINTARAQIVDTEALFEVLRERPDLTAIVDVADPTEPPPAGSLYYEIPNLILTPHIAGSGGSEVARMGDYAADDALRFSRGEKLKWAVSEAMLDRMA